MRNTNLTGADGREFPIAFLLHTFTIPKGNGVQLNRRPMASTTPSLSRVTTYKVPTSLLTMTISL